MKKFSVLKRRFLNYLRRTWANKVCAILFELLGFFSMAISPNMDATFFIFTLMLGTFLFFADENFIVW